MDALCGSISLSGNFDDVCKSKHAVKYLQLVKQAKQVQWRACDTLTENEIILCEMLEKQLCDEKSVKGLLLLYVKGGPLYRQISKLLFETYRKYDPRLASQI
jgi:predicted  nucleic acid-binding Zn ribbon protein